MGWRSIYGIIAAALLISAPASAQIPPLTFGGWGPFSVLRPFQMAANTALFPLRFTPFGGPVYRTTNSVFGAAYSVQNTVNRAPRTALNLANDTIDIANDAIWQTEQVLNEGLNTNIPLGPRYPYDNTLSYAETPQLTGTSSLSRADTAFNELARRDRLRKRSQGEGIKLRPDDAEEMFSVGIIFFLQADFDAAAAMFGQAAALDPTWTEATLWSAVSQLRGTAPEPRIPARAWTELAWPAPAVELFTGARSPESLLSEAERTTPPPFSTTGQARVPARLCEAKFFVAQYHLITGAPQAAQREVEGILGLCGMSGGVVSAAAWSEQQRLQSQQVYANTRDAQNRRAWMTGLGRFENQMDLDRAAKR